MSTTKRPGSDTSWVRRAPLWAMGFLVTWQMMVCLGLEDLLDPGLALAALLDVLGVVLDVAAVEHRVLGGADVDERRLHARQHVLDLAQVDVAVDLGDVVGRAGHVVLDEVAALEHGDLGGLGPHADRHEVAADRPALALAARGAARGSPRRARGASASVTASTGSGPGVRRPPPLPRPPAAAALAARPRPPPPLAPAAAARRDAARSPPPSALPPVGPAARREPRPRPPPWPPPTCGRRRGRGRRRPARGRRRRPRAIDRRRASVAGRRRGAVGRRPSARRLRRRRPAAGAVRRRRSRGGAGTGVAGPRAPAAGVAAAGVLWSRRRGRRRATDAAGERRSAAGVGGGGRGRGVAARAGRDRTWMGSLLMTHAPRRAEQATAGRAEARPAGARCAPRRAPGALTGCRRARDLVGPAHPALADVGRPGAASELARAQGPAAGWPARRRARHRRSRSEGAAGGRIRWGRTSSVTSLPLRSRMTSSVAARSASARGGERLGEVDAGDLDLPGARWSPPAGARWRRAVDDADGLDVEPAGQQRR